MRYCLTLLILATELVGTLGSARAQSLAEFQQLAAEQSPALRADYRAYEAAMERIATVNQLPEPNLSFGVFILPVETRVGPQQFRASLSQSFPWFGVLKAREEMATREAEALHARARDTQARLYLQVAQAYYALAEVQALLGVEKNQVTILERYRQVVNNRLANGEGSLSESLQVDLRIQDATVRVQNLEARQAPLAVALNLVVGQAEDTPVNVSPLALPQMLEAKPTLTDSLHPQWQQLERQKEAARAQATLSEKQGMPQLGLGLDYVAVGARPDMPTLEGNGRDVLMPMVQLSIPLHRNKYAAAVRAAVLQQEETALKQEALTNRLHADYAQRLNEREEYARWMAHYSAQEKKADRIIRQLLAEYGNGQARFEEILRWQEQQLDYQKQGLRALSDYYLAQEQLKYVTAKGE